MHCPGRLACATFLSAGLASGIAAAQPVADPMPEIAPSGITVRLPVRDETGPLAINETGGRIYLTTPAGGALGAPYLNLNGTASGLLVGLMGLAFAPDFAATGKF